MKKILMARWVLICTLGLMGSVGLFGTGVGEAQAAKAADCLAGTAFDAAKAACVPCPAGQYKNFDGEGACMQCPDGHICPRTGTAIPEMCQANKAARFDRTSCINCSNGFISEQASQCISPTNEMDSCCLKN
ncbi:hypothetical protein [Methylicorpusculum sp.]|uniref:hypothetical protein n=1 Tax=Methylicorpusculum sp. TaxID=2713644 RepID=UPI0027276263|nr:hypothetical protein [Methylicorpusculum sp.]MDO8845590.1 hypothetical protein [Methylicorpusculum sp.]